MSKLCHVFACSRFLNLSSSLENCVKINAVGLQQIRCKRYTRPLQIKYPMWFLQRERAKYEDQITGENANFIKDVMHDTFGEPIIRHGIPSYDVRSPLREEPFPRGKWNIRSQRTGLIGRKIGQYPLYMKDGSIMYTTLIQIVDNHVIKYIPPEQFNPPIIRYKVPALKKNLGCLLVGAESTDPQKFTKEYCGLFTSQGMMPKKVLGRFLITPEAAIQPGTPLYATHFKVGDYVDIRGKTLSRGFQGVMTRWGFHGMPATHGQTKTHRRPGCIGCGRDKRKVFKGKKLPGHMGNRIRLNRGIQILRINTKYNVLYVKGMGTPGGTGDIVYVFDTNVTHKRLNHHNMPHFPTFYPEEHSEHLPEDLYAPEVYDFSDPTITYDVPKETTKKKK